MTTGVRLLTRTDVEQWLLKPGGFTDEEIGICPIIELVELCEQLKKGKLKRLKRDSFRLGMQAIQEEQTIVIVSLDQGRLSDALFERDGYVVTGLWSPAANRNVSPTHSVRRLLLRPSDQTWWNGDIYAEAEAIYETEERETIADA